MMPDRMTTGKDKENGERDREKVRNSNNNNDETKWRV